MDESGFWRIVGAAKDGAGEDIEERAETLRLALEGLDLDGIQQFQRLYDRMLQRANRWPLWGAAYLMNGGCSDDCFVYFRHWLISEGKEVFERALDHPDWLVDTADSDYFELESFGQVALDVFETKGGEALERDPAAEAALPLGCQWDEDDLPAMFPRLAERFGY